MRAEKRFDETERLHALRQFGVLDTPREADFDAVVDMVTRVCGAPIAVINLIDETRQWFKAETGLGVRELPLDDSICAHAILEPGLFLIPDTLEDSRFIDNPLCIGEPHLRFYAGALLQTQDGFPLGTICVLDYKPRDLTQDQKDFLLLMADQVMRQLELKQTIALLDNERREAETGRLALEAALAEKEILISEIDHRVKNSLQLIQTILRMQAGAAAKEADRSLLDTAQARVSAVAHVHEQLHYSGDYKQVDMALFIQRLCGKLEDTAPKDVRLQADADDISMDARRAGSIGLIVNELVTNAFKYAYEDKGEGVTTVSLRRADDGDAVLSISDDGPGMIRDGESPREGLGTRLVKALAQGLDGTLEQSSSPNGYSVTVRFPVEVARPAES